MKASPLPSTPSFRLDGRRALVTGAGRGIGLAAAAALANAGAEVTLVARNHDEIDDAATAIREQGGKAASLALDVLDLSAVTHAIEAAEPFDILVNNAGTNIPKAFIAVEPREFDAVVNLNLRSVFL